MIKCVRLNTIKLFFTEDWQRPSFVNRMHLNVDDDVVWCRKNLQQNINMIFSKAS